MLLSVLAERAPGDDGDHPGQQSRAEATGQAKSEVLLRCCSIGLYRTQGNDRRSHGTHEDGDNADDDEHPAKGLTGMRI